MDPSDEFEEQQPYQGVPASIILINLFDPSGCKTATRALTATCGMIRQYLREATQQCVGVCLYGAEDTGDASKLGAKGVLDIFPLSPPNLEDFKKIQNINITNINPAKELTMSDTLLHCSKMFANCKKILKTRAITILSRLDFPPITTDQKPTLKRVEDLVDSNIDLRIINIGETQYEIHQFYNDFLLEANKGNNIVLPSPIWCEKEIEKLLYLQSHRHLAVAKISFEIGNGISIGVGVYNLLKQQGQTRQKKSDLDMETNTILTSVSKTVKVASGSGNDNNQMDVDQEQTPKEEPISKSELLYYQEYGEQRIEFTHEEMKVLRNPFGPPMLKLLGFKPASLMCKEKWFLKKSYFLFPNEGIIDGSTVAFKALHQACVETGMVAICILCTRVNSRPINVALSPCTNPLGLDIDMGFDVICIPFVENVRDVPNIHDDEEMNVNSGQKMVMKEIIKSIKFDYKPDMFENPKLQGEYTAVEAIALDELEIQPFHDTTKPKAEMFQNMDDELFYKFFGPFTAATTKRTAPSEDGHTVKKIKYEEMDESILQSQIANGDDLSKIYNVADLKKILKLKDMPDLPALTGLKKAELVNLVLQNFK